MRDPIADTPDRVHQAGDRVVRCPHCNDPRVRYGGRDPADRSVARWQCSVCREEFDTHPHRPANPDNPRWPLVRPVARNRPQDAPSGPRSGPAPESIPA